MCDVQIELAGQARTYWGHRVEIQSHSLWMQSAALLQLPLGTVIRQLTREILGVGSGKWGARVPFQLHSITRVPPIGTAISIAERL